MRIFEITGNNVKGGENEAHNQFLVNRVEDLEGFAKSIGKSLGMTCLDSLVVTTDTDGYGFRFARSSNEKFDTCGVQIEGRKVPSEIVSKLG